MAARGPRMAALGPTMAALGPTMAATLPFSEAGEGCLPTRICRWRVSTGTSTACMSTCSWIVQALAGPSAGNGTTRSVLDLIALIVLVLMLIQAPDACYVSTNVHVGSGSCCST
eukprot:1999719-Rhodomonas_salina.1